MRAMSSPSSSMHTHRSPLSLLALSLLLGGVGCGRVGYESIPRDGSSSGPDSSAPDSSALDAGTRDAGPFDAGPPPPLTLEAEAVVGARSLDVTVTPSDDADVAILVTSAPLTGLTAADAWAMASADGRVVPGSGGTPRRELFDGLVPETVVWAYAVAQRGAELSNVVEMLGTATHPLFTAVTFPATEGDSVYVAYTPERAYRDPSAPLPLILFLHGWGAMGALPDELPMNDGMFREIAMDVPAFRDFHFMVIAPICDSAIHAGCFGWTNTRLAVEALDDAVARFPIDARRVYVTGLSTGGQGTLELAAAYPDRVAAAVAIASTYRAGLASTICRMAGVPVWMFHSSIDILQLPANSQMYFDVLSACPPTSAPPQLDLYPWTYGGNNHAGWVEVYGDDHSFTNMGHASIYEWFLSFSLP